MISNLDYMKLAMSYENDKTEIDPVLRSRVWGVVLVGLAMFWSITRSPSATSGLSAKAVGHRCRYMSFL